MTESTRAISPLRQRMTDDMRLRKLNPRTQTACIRAVKNFTRFFGQSPDAATAEDLRRYQLYLVQQNTSSTTLNAILTGWRFCFEITLDKPDVMKLTSHVHQPRKLPVILSIEEIAKLLQVAGSLKYQAALGVAYGAGLRASEVVHLTVTDIDNQRMVIRVEQGKRDRYAMLSPALLGHQKLDNTAPTTNANQQRHPSPRQTEDPPIPGLPPRPSEERSGQSNPHNHCLRTLPRFPCLRLVRRLPVEVSPPTKDRA